MRAISVLGVSMAAALVGSCGGHAATGEPGRTRHADDWVSERIEAVPLRVRHAHVARSGARLLSMTVELDGTPMASREWRDESEGAPELRELAATGDVSPGAHELVVVAEYSLYTCCYACGYFQGATLRTAHRFTAARGAAIELCIGTGAGSPTAPIEQTLAPAIGPCPGP